MGNIMPFRRYAVFMAILVTGLVALLPTAGAQAQAGPWPAKAIRFVVPFPPGGPLDTVARALAQAMTMSWGQPVIVDNRPGAGGGIGADIVAKSPGDGYTLLMGAVSTHAINASLYAKIPYDPLKDFIPVTQVANVPNVLVVNPGVAANSVQELIALAKKNPGTLNFASGSNGSTGHLAGELFKSMAGIDMQHIPYKGAAPATSDLLAGQVSLMFDNLASATPLIKSGKLRALAVTTLRRTPFFPELPTISESGLPGFDLSTWFGVFVPAGTPPDIVARLNAELVRILKTPEMRERLASLGAEPVGNSPAEFLAYIRSEIPKYAKVIRESGAKVD
jgi:tripartite-type tricarboxylate transporter receptor subunit TctC